MNTNKIDKKKLSDLAMKSVSKVINADVDLSKQAREEKLKCFLCGRTDAKPLRQCVLKLDWDGNPFILVNFISCAVCAKRVVVDMNSKEYMSHITKLDMAIAEPGDDVGPKEFSERMRKFFDE